MKKAKIFYKVLAVCLIFVVSITLFRGLNFSLAATNGELPDTMISKSGDPVTEGMVLLGGIFNAPKYLTPEDGSVDYVVYCLNKEKGWPNNHILKKSKNALDNGYAYLALNGYPSKSLTGDNATDLYLTQITFWFYQDRVNGVSDNADGVLTAVEKQDIINSSYYNNYIKGLIEGALNAKDVGNVPNIDVSISTSSFKLSDDGLYLITDLINLSSNINFNSYNVSLNNSNYQVLDENNHVVTGSIAYGKGFKICIPLNKVTSTTERKVSLSIVINYTQRDTYLYEPDASDTNTQDVAIAAVEATSKQKTITEEVSFPTGSLSIKKVSSLNPTDNLEGAKIQVKRIATNEIIKTFTTTSNEEVISDLLPGKYTVTELEAPAGYLIDSSKDIIISDTNLNPSTKMTDQKITAKIMKVDDDGNPLAGAVINVYRSSDNSLVKSFTSTSGYTILDNLTEGSYYAEEITPPPGYKKDTTRHNFTLSRDNNVVDFKIKNVKNTTNIIKTDENNNPLSGAILRVVNSSGTKMDEWETTTMPHTLEGLAAGTYYIEELKAPSGYTRSLSRISFTIEADQQVTQTVAFPNTKNTLSILKVDENNLPIAGATLRLYNSSGSYSKEFKTTTTATVFDKLASGTYYIEEIKAPDGFVRDKSRKTITITENTTNESITLANKRNQIKIAKVDAQSGAYLAGAKLQLIAPDGSLVESWTSTNEAHVVSSLSLKHGTYTLKEIAAPTGYLLNATPVQITINEDSDNEHIYKMNNERIDIKVLKVDENGVPLKGVTLTLLDADKKSLNKTWLTTDRAYSLEGLGEGTYYVQETNTIAGYILDNSLKKIVVDRDHLIQTVTIANKPIVLKLAKVDASTNKIIPGATLKLSREDNSMEPITWVSTDSVKTLKGIRAGNYILEEVSPPTGYVSSGAKVVFTVKNTGEVQQVVLKSNYITLNINNKRLHVDTQAVSGFKFQLLTSTGTEVENWVSDKNVHVSKQLENGTYILREVSVPDGYILNKEPYYVVVSDDNNGPVKILNDTTKVMVSKKDITNGEEVEGAKLVLKDASDKVIDTWISTTEPHLITKLPVGKYKLTEEIAPDGYVLNTSTVEFEVLETVEVQTVVMYNQPKVNVPNTSRSISKGVYIIAIILMFSGLGLIMLSISKKKLN